MASSRKRRSKAGSRNDARTPDESRAARNRHVTASDVGAKALAERERAVMRREDSVSNREHSIGTREAALRGREASVQTGAEVEQLMGQMREANERLVVAAVNAQNLSDEAYSEAAQVRTELEGLIRQLRDAHERLAAAVAHAHTMAEDAGRRQEEYQQLSGRLLTLQDEERRRLAIDLHESTGQRLAALTMNLDLVEGAGKALDARSRRVLAESRSLAAQCAQEVRTFAYLLHPPLLDEVGLVSAMRWYAEGFTTRSGIQVVMNVGDVGRLPRPIETALFRIVQESLTNVHRHASTSMASIRLMSTADTVVLEIQNQGRGLRDDLRSEHGALLPATLGVGIQGMRERIRQLGGMFDVEFTEQGTTVRVSVPWSGYRDDEDDPHPHR